jgi:TolB-like protein
VSGEDGSLILGPYRLDRSGRTLTRDGVAIPLGGRAFDTLAALAAANGRTLSKDQLLDRVWPGLTVEENNLQVQISTLRKTLGDGWIVTEPNRGYRLVVPPPAAPPGPPLPDKPSLVVLPFQNLSGDPEQEYFADGMAEDIITQLSHSNVLLVIARNTSFTYRGRTVDVKEIGRELAVRYVLQGSVRRAGERVRISAQLADALDGSQVWAERYDRPIVDVFEVQDEISSAVARAIEPAISYAEQQRISRKPPESLSAWEACQRGLWHAAKLTAENSRQA